MSTNQNPDSSIDLKNSNPTMNLLELPNEILVSIFQRLDLKSKISVASSCERLASVLCRSDLVGSVSFSRTAFAVQILQHDTFSILAPHIRQLELSNVSNLDKTWLVPTLKLMRNLSSLDLSLTDIVLLNLAEVCELCADLTSLTVNYSRPYCDIPQIDNVEALKKSFSRLEYVHLYGDVKAFHSLDAIRLLQDSNLKELKLTTVTYIGEDEFNRERFDSSFNELPFKTFSAFINNNVTCDHMPLYYITVIEKLCNSGWEFVVIEGSNVTVSPEFHRTYKSFDSVTFSYRVSSNLDGFKIFGNTHLFMWHPGLAINSNFRNKIMNIVQRRRQQFVCMRDCCPPIQSIDESHIFISAGNFKEYVIRYPDDHKRPEHYSLLNIDRLSKFGHDLKLSFVRMGCHIYPGIYDPLTLGPTTDILYNNIVYLHFDPEMERYLSSDFLSALFQHCPRLETLYYDNEVKYLENALMHSNSLKNLMVFNRISNPLPFLRGMAKCLSLENIHICDGSFSSEIGHMKYFTEGLSELVESCTRLYNLEYHAAWVRRARKTQMLSIIKVLKKAGRDMRCDLAFYDHDWGCYKSRIRINPYCRVFLGHDWFKLISNRCLNL